MQFLDTINNFLYDQNYFISLYDNKIHLYKYLELTKLTSKEIIVLFNDFKLNIKGDNLTIIQMNKEELLIQGNIFSVGKNNE